MPDKAATDQRERFIVTARKLGADDDEAAFEERLKRIAKAKPKPPQK
jgi:hypothetical protein